MRIFILLFLIGVLYTGTCTAQTYSENPQDTLHLTNHEKLQQRVDTLRKYVRGQYYKKNYDRTIEVGEEALILANQIKDYKSIYNISSAMGNAFLQIEDTLQAKRMFSETLLLAEGRKDSLHILSARIDLGNMYALQDKHQSAINLYKKAIPLAERLSDTTRLFILNHNITEMNLNQEEVEEASKYIVETKKFVNNLESDYYEAGYELLVGRLYYLKNELDLAALHLKRSIDISEELSFIDGLLDAYKYYAKTEALRGNYKKAFALQEKLDFYKSQKYQTDKIEAIETVTAKFKLNQFKQELRATELQNEYNEQKAKRETTIFWVKIAAGILLLFSLFLIFSYIRRKRLLTDLREKNKAYLAAKEKSEELSKAKSALFSNISHELRTPMYGIIGISSILIEDKNLTSHKENLKSLKLSADYLLSLINNVLQLNKLDATQDKQLRKVSFNLRELVHNIIKSSEFIRTTNTNTFDVVIDPALPTFLIGDDVKLSQVLFNLIGNSCKFTENGVISLHISRLEDKNGTIGCHFVIKDTGIGISSETQKQIFDEFTQLSHGVDYQGTGLGLPIVKKILDLHHAEITLKSKLGVGTEISFDIFYEPSEKPVDLDQVTPNQSANIKGKKILVVDDNRINQLVTQKCLEKFGATSRAASSGAEAVKLAKEDNFDLILMDINMPGMNGFEASSQIRSFDPTTPIIALTAVEIEKIKDDMLSSGINDLIIKPYNNSVFIATISKNLLLTTKAV